MRTALVRPDRYTQGAVLFHWTIAVLVIVNVGIGLLHAPLLEGVQGAMPLHRSIGLTVLVLTFGRIAWRLAHRPPPLPAAMPVWERLSAKAMHAAFYGLMLVLPLSGWILSSNPARRAPLSWFGLVDIPVLPVSAPVSAAAHTTHEWLGVIMAGLIVLHVVAALRHHFVTRDAVLSRMIPVLVTRY